MTNTPKNPNRDEWRDRLVDRALDETVGGESPPDLSEQILAAADLSSPTGELTMPTATKPKSLGLRSWVLAASVIINVGLAAMLLRQGDAEPMVAKNDTATEQPAEDGRINLNTAGGENADFDSLVEVIQSTVESETWTDNGGGDTELGIDDSQSERMRERLADRIDPTGTRDITIRQRSSGSAKEAMAGKPDDRARVILDKTETDYSIGLGVNSDAGVVGSVPAFEGHYANNESGLATKESLRATYGWDGVSASRDRRTETLKSLKRDATWEMGFQIADANVRLGYRKDFGGGGRGREWSMEHSWGGHKEKIFEASLASNAEIMKTDQRIMGLRFRLRDSLNRSSNQATPETREIKKQLASVQRKRARLATEFREQWHGSADGEGIGPGASGDQYERIYENPFIAAIGGEAISTFSIDVDTASYSNTRQMLLSGHLPPPDAVRLEELVNYFDYSYEGPEAPSPNPSPESGGGELVPFAAHVEVTGCPWQPKHRLVRIGVKGREVAPEKRPLSNLVFLVDVSGSMQDPAKLPLVRHGMMQLAAQLGENDRVAIVVYASQEGLVLPSTPGTEQEAILSSLDNLRAGGSTAGGAGITLAYQIAEDNFIKGGTNRVILCTDGDFNVGTTSTAELERLVEKKAKDTGVFLSVVGFGRGNLNDAMMEKITGIGNGNYYYVDGERESERVFVKGMTGMLVTIAKDVKIQVEFNPAKVAGYRLLGYENRMLETQDFNDDKKDAGEIGAGHTVTCLYEIVPAGEPVEAADIDDLKYQRPAALTEASDTGELLTLKMRYKQPDEDVSTKLEWPATDAGKPFGEASEDLQFAAAVASFGMLLRDSQYQGDASFDAILEIAAAAVGDDPEGDRSEFLELVRAAKRLRGDIEPAEEASKNADADDTEKD